MTFSPDGKQVAVTLMGDATQLIDVETAKGVRTLSPPGGGAAASACVFSPDGKRLATAGFGLEQAFTGPAYGRSARGKNSGGFPAAIFPSGNGEQRSLAFSPNGATLARGGWGDGRLRLGDGHRHGVESLPQDGQEIVSVGLCPPDRETVAAAADDVYSLRPGDSDSCGIRSRPRRLAFSRDGSVLTGGVGGEIRWDAASGRPLAPVRGPGRCRGAVLIARRPECVHHRLGRRPLRLGRGQRQSPRRIGRARSGSRGASPDGRFLAEPGRPTSTAAAGFGSTTSRPSG